jgi:ribosomal protein S18 acetylase RimI-like enzyme
MDVEIGPLPRQRVRAASLLLARAFADDGILTHYLAGRRGRRIAIPAFFCAVIHEHLATTYAATAGPELVGVLSCAGPDEPRAHLGARIRARSRLLQVHALFPRSSRQLLAGFRSMERLHPPHPHWYLAFAAVEPALQGQGIGDALLRPVLQQADSDDVPCYLETPFPRTQALYRRLGFEIVSESRPFKDARPLCRMIRVPQRRTPPSQFRPAAPAP